MSKTKNLTFHPSILVNPKDGKSAVLHLEYYPIQKKYKKKELNIPSDNDFILLSSTKILFLIDDKYAYYDLVSEKLIPLDCFNNIKIIHSVPFPGEKEKVSKFYVTTPVEDIMLDIRIIQINNNNARKFKFLEFLGSINKRKVVRLDQIAPNALIIKDEKSINYYRRLIDMQKFYSNLKTFDGDCCYFSGDHPCFIKFDDYHHRYQLFSIKENETIDKFLPYGTELTFIREKIRIKNNIMALIGPIGFVSIKTFKQNESEVIVTSNKMFKYKRDKPDKVLEVIPLNDHYFGIKLEKVIQLWRIGEFDHNLEVIIPLELEKGNYQFLLLPPSFEVRKEVVNYLQNLIPIPKELVATTLDFFF